MIAASLLLFVCFQSPEEVYNFEFRKFIEDHNRSFISSTKEYDDAVVAWQKTRNIYSLADPKASQKAKEVTLEKAKNIRKELESLIRRWEKVIRSLECIDP